jgi:negative regulator of sigma E activity
MSKNEKQSPENASKHLVALMHGELAKENKAEIETALEESPVLKEEFASYQLIADLFKKTIDPNPETGFLARMEKSLDRERKAGRISQRVVAFREFSQEMPRDGRTFAPWVISLLIHAAAVAIAVTLYLQNNTADEEDTTTLTAGLIPSILENKKELTDANKELYLLIVDSLGEKPWRGEENSLFRKRLDADWRKASFKRYAVAPLESRLKVLLNEIKKAQRANGSWKNGTDYARPTCLALLALCGSGEPITPALKKGLSWLMGQSGRLSLQKEGGTALGLSLALAVEASILAKDKILKGQLKSFIRDIGSALGRFQEKDGGFSEFPSLSAEVEPTLAILYGLSLAQAGRYKIRNRSMLLALKYLIYEQEKNKLALSGLLALMEFQGVQSKDKSIRKLAADCLKNSQENSKETVWQEHFWTGTALYFNESNLFKKHIQACSEIKTNRNELSLIDKCYQALSFETIFRYPRLSK